MAVISFRFKDVDIIDIGLIVEDRRRFSEAKAKQNVDDYSSV